MAELFNNLKYTSTMHVLGLDRIYILCEQIIIQNIMVLMH